jgi:hypothetical protein
MKTIFTKLLAGSLITATIFTACSKNNSIDELNNGPQQSATAREIAAIENPNILNQDLKITYARDGATDITEEMDDFTLRFAGTYPGGQAHVWNDLLAQTGSWSMVDAASPITMSFPTNIFTQLVFLNRDWTIGSVQRGFIVLTAADGDELHLISKEQ